MRGSPIGVLAVVAAIAMMVTVAVGGCSSDSLSAENGRQGVNSGAATAFLDQEAVGAEYDAAAAQLEMPPGMSFPGMCEGAEGGVWEPGSGIAQAQLHWMYAWETEWLEQRGEDPVRQAKALDVLQNEVPVCDMMTKYSDTSNRDWFNACLEKALLGDPTGFQQDIDANNPQIIRDTTGTP